MKLYKFQEQDGPRVAFAPEQNPDGLPAGFWLATGSVEVLPGSGRQSSADPDDILEGIEREGVFVWPLSND